MKYEIETFLDNLQGYEKEKEDLKNNYLIYKGIKHTFPSKICFEILDNFIFKNNNNKVNHGPFDIKFLMLLTEIQKENNKILCVPETLFTF